MIRQSFLRRSTDYEGNSHIISDISKRRVSSARSRESFFIPQLLKKVSIRLLTLIKNTRDMSNIITPITAEEQKKKSISNLGKTVT